MVTVLLGSAVPDNVTVELFWSEPSGGLVIAGAAGAVRSIVQA